MSSFSLVPVIAAALALLIPSGILHAQDSPIPCGLDSGSTHHADLSVDVEVPPGGESALQSTIWHFDESIWLTPEDGIVLIPDLTSLRFIGPDEGVVDLLPFSAIIDILAVEGIRRSIAAGHIDAGDIVEVLTPACVARSGSGTATMFFPCSPNCCRRTYLVFSPLPGTLLILPLLEDTSVCDPVPDGCEQGCNGLPPVP